MLTEQQLEVRSTGLGGTDLVAICGESPYRSPIDVYLEKRVGLKLPVDMEAPNPFEGNERTLWGNVLEPVLAERYAEDTGLSLVEPTHTLRHPDREWHLGTPDRFAYVQGEMVEACKTPIGCVDASSGKQALYPQPIKIWEGKTHGHFGGKAYDLKDMEVPDEKRIQVASYMALTGCKEADLSALFDTHLYRVFHIPHDQEVEDYLLEEGELFWQRIQEGNPPEPDGSKSFSRYLAQRFKLHTADMVEVPSEEIGGQIERYKHAREMKKDADEWMVVCKQKIQEAIGAHAGLLNDEGKPAVTWKRKAVGSTSWGKVAKALRDRYAYGMSDEEFERLVEEFTGEPQRLFLVK